ncbi:hypothetical protein I2700191B6_08700 [Dorea formicigenerans]
MTGLNFMDRLHWKKSIQSFNKISIIYGGQLARRKSSNYALIFPENILLTLFFMSMNTIFTYFRICENSYK